MLNCNNKIIEIKVFYQKKIETIYFGLFSKLLITLGWGDYENLKKL